LEDKRLQGHRQGVEDQHHAEEPFNPADDTTRLAGAHHKADCAHFAACAFWPSKAFNQREGARASKNVAAASPKNRIACLPFI
jgi:hypothetical protein